MKLNYGIVSAATVTTRFIHAIQEYGDIVHAIASLTSVNATKLAQRFHIPNVYTTYEELYNDASIDIVYIATNNASHVSEVKKALLHGKHVVCEKPIALSKNDAQDLFALAKKQKRFLMEAQKSVFLPITQRIKTILQEDQLGVLHQIEMSSSFSNPTSLWMHDPLQGGVVYGSASYTIEYLMYLLQPTTIHVQALGKKENTGTLSQVSINLHMDDVVINSRIAMNVSTRKHALFYFDHGYINVPEYWKANTCYIHQGTHVEKICYPVQYEMIYEVEHIHACIANKLYISPIMSDNVSITCCGFVDQIIQTC